jgi:hypothetical protein
MKNITPYLGTALVVLVVLAIVSRVDFLRKIVQGG